jgi:hypothetical protein
MKRRRSCYEDVKEVEKKGAWSYILEKSDGITPGQEATGE